MDALNCLFQVPAELGAGLQLQLQTLKPLDNSSLLPPCLAPVGKGAVDEGDGHQGDQHIEAQLPEAAVGVERPDDAVLIRVLREGAGAPVSRSAGAVQVSERIPA